MNQLTNFMNPVAKPETFDMIKIGIFITLVEFVLLVLTVALWWPILGIASR